MNGEQQYVTALDVPKGYTVSVTAGDTTASAVATEAGTVRVDVSQLYLEQNEWVEVCSDIRVSRDGERAQVLEDRAWLDLLMTTAARREYIEAYRKGRETGLEDGRKQAEALRDAVLNLDRSAVLASIVALAEAMK